MNSLRGSGQPYPDSGRAVCVCTVLSCQLGYLAHSFARHSCFLSPPASLGPKSLCLYLGKRCGGFSLLPCHLSKFCQHGKGHESWGKRNCLVR